MTFWHSPKDVSAKRIDIDPGQILKTKQELKLNIRFLVWSTDEMVPNARTHNIFTERKEKQNRIRK